MMPRPHHLSYLISRATYYVSTENSSPISTLLIISTRLEYNLCIKPCLLLGYAVIVITFIVIAKYDYLNF